MNADRLLALYEKVAEAPNAVPRLRRFVLDLAVRGKLVEQDPTDEPASELLKRIAAEKARLVKAGELREPRNAVVIKRDELPFVPPAHWVWARLIDIARPSYGFAFKSSQFNGEKRGMPLIRIRDISKMDTEAYYEGEYDPGYLVRAGDYLVGMDGDFNLRRWAGPDGLLNQRVMRINGWRCEIDPKFVKLPLQMILGYLHGDTSLTTVKHLSAKQVNGIEIPLPPLAEQRRIVGSEEELMALLDRLEAVRTTREATRDRLTAASLARLTAPGTDQADFPANARFALATLPALTTHPDQIKPLRQTILNLAVRGKLVEQNPTDEPASELLDKLHSESSKKKKTARTSPAKHAAEMSFECPPGWAWAQVRQILAPDRDISYGVIKLGPEPKSGGVPTLRCSDVRPGFIDLSGVRKVQESIEADYARTRLEGGEVVINIRGTLGGVALVPDDLKGHNVAREVAVIPIAADLSGPFLVYLMLSPYFWDHIQNNLRGIAYKGLNLGILRELPIPLPPLAEQHRIVAKVDVLMALCDRLETSLTTADTTRARLLEVLLHEVLGSGLTTRT
ncbi:restriction endonuclease subunit S [uncultured Jannaschia sp.]|uniref:restriction endonuclease subunit S n=1 Tax=uncultured Jannaschia sp. TaxID=293347 RepID=UPI0026147C07|nr:restriction endonuclease subunit S [uncultured Jannaschia sp.]